MSALQAQAASRYFRIGERFERRRTLDAREVGDFARQVGDTNPLHHDAALAASTRFGGSGAALLAAFERIAAAHPRR